MYTFNLCIVGLIFDKRAPMDVDNMNSINFFKKILKISNIYGEKNTNLIKQLANEILASHFLKMFFNIYSR